MAKEYARTQRVADYLQRELAAMIQREVRDPRLGMVSVTGVEVSRDLGHAKVYFTVLDADSKEEAREVSEVLNRPWASPDTVCSTPNNSFNAPRR